MDRPSAPGYPDCALDLWQDSNRKPILSDCGAFVEQHFARYPGQPSSDPPHTSRCSVCLSIVLLCSSVAPKGSKGHRHTRLCYYRQACTHKVATNSHRPRNPECQANTGHRQGVGEPGYPDCSTHSIFGTPAYETRIPRLRDPRRRCNKGAPGYPDCATSLPPGVSAPGYPDCATSSTEGVGAPGYPDCATSSDLYTRGADRPGGLDASGHLHRCLQVWVLGLLDHQVVAQGDDGCHVDVGLQCNGFGQCNPA